MEISMSQGMTRNLTIAATILGGLLTGLVPSQSGAQSIPWPSFGPDRGLLHLDGLTDTLSDFVGPLDGSAELTIFTEGNHFPVLLPLVLDAFPTWCKRAQACRVEADKVLVVTLPQPMVVDMLVKGGIRLGNAVVPVGRDQRVFPDFVMGGPEPLRALASTLRRGPTISIRRLCACKRDLRHPTPGLPRPSQGSCW
jgi:hypothetical protein